ncbi:MAG: hypothetical protein J2P48_01240 [Alphaproteobacteria bacterium]|nr:hypothetical protein [Alphaproteobacteria bacterium]
MTRLPGSYLETATKNWDELGQAYKDFWKKETIAGKAWSGLQVLGAAGNYLFSPVEAGIRSFVGEPIEAVGRPVLPRGTGRYIGELGSLATQVAFDPIARSAKAAGAIRSAKIGGYDIGGSIEKMLSPTTRTPEAGRTELLNRPRAAELAQATSQARNDLEQFRKQVGTLDRDTRLDFMLSMGGEAPRNRLPVGLQPMAQKLRGLLDERTKRLQSLGLLENAIDDYWPRLWKDPNRAQTARDALHLAQAGAVSKTPIRGSRAAAGLKQRALDTMREGLDLGPEPVSDNPLDVALIRMRGMDKWYYGSKLAADMKAQPYVRFFGNPTEVPAGWQRLNDPVFTVRLPPVAGETREAARQALKTSSLSKAEQGEITARLYGTPEMGGYYAPEPAARVFNNYTSRGWAHENGIYDAFRHAGNALNMLQLGLSGFHYLMVSLDSTVSSLARIPSLLARGRFGEAARAAPGALPLAGPLYTGARLARQAAAPPAAAIAGRRRCVSPCRSS